LRSFDHGPPWRCSSSYISNLSFILPIFAATYFPADL